MTLGKRLFLGALFLVVFTSAISFFAAERWLRPSIENHFADLLGNEALLIATALEQRPADLQAVAHRMGRLIGRRVSIIDSVGVVVGDSDFDDAGLARLDNHIDRPELRALLAGEPGVARRLSASTNREELKVAVLSWPGFVRVSAPLTQVESLLGTITPATLLAGLLATLAGLTLAAIGGRALGGPIARLAAAAKAVSRREEVAFPTSSVPEIRDLVTSFRTMDRELGARIEEINREREETSSMLETMAQGVVSVGPEGKIRYANAAAHQIFDFRPMAGTTNFRNLVEDREVLEVLDTVLDDVPVNGRELNIGGRSLLTTGHPLPNESGAVLGFLDITDLKRVEVVRRDFVANVSHELKTPLTNVLGYSETLMKEDVDPENLAVFVSVIHHNSRRMQRIVDDLLDLARIESGSWQPSWEEVSPSAIASECWLNVAHKARKNVEFEVDDRTRGVILADPDGLRQVFTNLFDNSARYTTEGKISLEAVSENGWVTLTVRDTGSGIGAEHIERIFERFYRADPARSREEGGTGLGLSIVKHLVEAHGGVIELQSEIGVGTATIIRIPQNRAIEMETPPQAQT